MIDITVHGAKAHLKCMVLKKLVMVEQTGPKYKLAGLALLIVCVRPGLEMMDASNPDDISDAGKSFNIQELVVPDLGL